MAGAFIMDCIAALIVGVALVPPAGFLIFAGQMMTREQIQEGAPRWGAAENCWLVNALILTIFFLVFGVSKALNALVPGEVTAFIDMIAILPALVAAFFFGRRWRDKDAPPAAGDINMRTDDV